MQTQAKAFRVSQLAEVAIGLIEPSVILLENGPAFSVLIADSIDWQAPFRRLALNDTSQLRIEETGHSVIRRFPTVYISHEDDSGLWRAHDASTRTIFRCPSRSPYAVLPLTRSEHHRLKQAESVADIDQMFGQFRSRFGELPGFYAPASDTLISPDDYACAFDCADIAEAYY